MVVSPSARAVPELEWLNLGRGAERLDPTGGATPPPKQARRMVACDEHATLQRARQRDTKGGSEMGIVRRASTSVGAKLPRGKRRISGPTSFKNSSSSPMSEYTDIPVEPEAERGATLNVALTLSSRRSVSISTEAAMSTGRSPESASPGAISTATSCELGDETSEAAAILPKRTIECPGSFFFATSRASCSVARWRSSYRHWVKGRAWVS
eukprot:scaffold320164_cov32-Tisochrysis_lutea.AAC.3